MPSSWNVASAPIHRKLEKRYSGIHYWRFSPSLDLLRKHFKKYLPDRHAITANRWLKPFGSTVLHPHLWHLTRDSVAGGVAIGMFCGLLPAPFQMATAAIASLIFKTNLPVAVLTTLYTNPVTFVPLYILAYYIGLVVTGNGTENLTVVPPEFEWRNWDQWFSTMMDWFVTMGKPLIVGLLLLATSLSLLGYFLVQWIWRFNVSSAWRKRKKIRRSKKR